MTRILLIYTEVFTLSYDIPHVRDQNSVHLQIFFIQLFK